jgi:hypothetical protein
MSINVNELVLVQGWSDTRAALNKWNRNPWGALRPWLLLSVLIACALLFAVYVVARLTTPDVTFFFLPGYNSDADIYDYGLILFRNSLVLALHAMACVAGFMAGSSLPLSASKRTGFSRWVHEKAGPIAIAWVVACTMFSLGTQAYVIGGTAATVSAQLDLSPGVFLLALLPHALPELTALFLPLAAWMIASRRDDWHELLAATFVTTGVAVPTLLVAGLVELYVSPDLLRLIAS